METGLRWEGQAFTLPVLSPTNFGLLPLSVTLALTGNTSDLIPGVFSSGLRALPSHLLRDQDLDLNPTQSQWS